MKHAFRQGGFGRRWSLIAIGWWCCAVAAAVGGGVVYLVGWHNGGIRTAWGTFSGSRLPAEAAALSSNERWEQTRARAESIRLAVLAFESRTGELPTLLSDLVAAGDLVAVPVPLTSTTPFRYGTTRSGTGEVDFTIIWELFPNAMYEKSWIDRAGDVHSDM